jgi:hypothetical protein
MSDIEVRRTADRGDGVFAKRMFLPGDIVIEGYIEEVLSGNTSHASEIGIGKYVLHGGLMSKVNHSCDPNCGVRLNASGAHDLVARKVISIDEELSYDYAMRNSKIEHFPAICLCGSLNCRKRITGWNDLTPSQKASYEGFVAPHLIDTEGPE